MLDEKQGRNDAQGRQRVRLERGKTVEECHLGRSCLVMMVRQKVPPRPLKRAAKEGGGYPGAGTDCPRTATVLFRNRAVAF